MVKRCNGQGIFLSKDDRSRSPPPRRSRYEDDGYSGGRGKGGYETKGYGKGWGKTAKGYDREDGYDAGYWKGIAKGMSKGKDRGYDRKGYKGDRKGDRKGDKGWGKGKSESKGKGKGDRKAGKGKGRKGEGEASARDLDDELDGYFGIAKAPRDGKKDSKEGKKDEAKGEDLDNQLEKYMTNGKDTAKEADKPAVEDKAADAKPAEEAAKAVEEKKD